MRRLWRPKYWIGVVLAIPLLIMFPAYAYYSSQNRDVPYDWLQFNFDAQHSGNDVQEHLINLDNVSTLHRLFQTTLNGTYLSVADGAPAYISQIRTTNGVHDLLFVTTMPGDLIALDAQTGAQLWAHQTNPSDPCYIHKNTNPCYTTSSPAIDPDRQYVYSYGLDGCVHKYRISDGTEIMTGGWPEMATHKGYEEKGSSALSIVADKQGHHYLYVTHAGYPGDGGDYQGHVTIIDLVDGKQHVINALCMTQADTQFEPPDAQPDCSEQQAGIWARSGVVYDPDMDRIYVSTGNGAFDPEAGNWGDSVLAFHPNGSGVNIGNPLDSYTPANADEMNDTDSDLGSAEPTILPPTEWHHYAVQGGKDAKIRIIDLDNMSAQGHPGAMGGELPGSLLPIPQGGQLLTQPVAWTNPTNGQVWVLVGNYSGLSGIPLNESGTGWQTPWVDKDSGCWSPIVANGVLFCVGGTAIRAFDPLTGVEKWHDDTLGSMHWQGPIVANGVLYVTDNAQHVSAYTIGH